MPQDEIDRYLSALDEPERATLTRLRETIVSIVPDAEQCISYGVPAFKLEGKTIAGFAAFKHHLSYLPHSGSVIDRLAKETEGFTKTKGSLHFPSMSRCRRRSSRSSWTPASRRRSDRSASRKPRWHGRGPDTERVLSRLR